MYVNPYSGQDFFGFFAVVLSRLMSFFTGHLSWQEIVSDEIQLIVLSSVAITGALVGTFLVLRKMAMLANALSHTILLGIVIAYFISPEHSVPVLMIAALVTGLATTFMTEFLHRIIKLQEDASIGLVFSLLFALGIALLSIYSRNVHIGSELVMGNVDALQRGDITLVTFVLVMNALLFFWLYYGFHITTFDPNLARTFGFSPIFFNYLLMVQTSATAIGAFKAVGVLMILAFLIFPALTARRWSRRVPHMIAIAIIIGVTATCIGVALSRHILTLWDIGLSTAGLVVIVLGVLYFSTLLLHKLIDFCYRYRYTQDANANYKNEKNCCTG